jgi:molybdate transport system substrate-binding protein
MKPSIQKIAIGKPATVPAGRYAQQVLEANNLWQPLAAKIIPSENVRQVLDYVARGEVDAGFVYRTDATHFGDKVRIVLTPTQPPIFYPIAVVSDSKQKDLAAAFVTYLLSAPAQQVLLRYGFGTL